VVSYGTTRAAGTNGVPRGYAAFQLLTAAFIELDIGDARFLQALSRLIFGPTSVVTITIPHYWALVHLEPFDGRTMAELAQLLVCDRSNVTAIVDKLEERGWAQRVRGKAGDRRFTSVVLTEEGRSLRDIVVRAHDQWVSVRFAGLSSAQLAQLASLLHELRSGLRVDPEEVASSALPREASMAGQAEPRTASKRAGVRATRE
jgi:DNA-binding MarR family transcriptional regulator